MSIIVLWLNILC